MKKLFAALLVAALCLAVPAIAQSMDDIPAEGIVFIVPGEPPGAEMGTYFDVFFCGECNGNGDDGFDCENGDCCIVPVGDPFAGWCVDTTANAIRDDCYCANLYSTIGESEKWNRVNWILNNKGDATFGEIQAAIWMAMDQVNRLHPEWEDSGVAAELAAAADPEFEPECGDIMAVWIVPCDGGQQIIIEVEIPPCPPVPEFPTMMIPVFFVGGVLIASSVLKRR